ncbi:MAG: amino acid adenylation domain-containing protein, partial [Methylococcaceae bacterium]|nr:amino acid adenylation domain-containing protein [Methylococcaceae bacterium]
MHSQSNLAGQPAKLSQAKQALLEQRLRGKQDAGRPVTGSIGKRPEGPAPLSPAQQRLWLLYQLEPDSPGYNYSTALRLSGHLDLAALEECIHEIVRRHEILRTRIVEIDGQPRQIIAPELRLSPNIHDLSALPPEQREAQAIRLAKADGAKPFDLSIAPLLRVNLLCLGSREQSDEFMLLFTVHHIAYDGWSAGVLLKEFTALYPAFVEGRPSPLPALPIQYADFAYWQQHKPRQAQQLAYWKSQLEGMPALLPLPTDHPRPAVRSFQGASHAFHVPQSVTEPLRALCRRHGVTLFAALFAAFNTLLYRYSGQRDMGMGVPAAGRTNPELEGLIGFFVNTLVLRTRLDHDTSFAELLESTQEVALKAQEHQDIPFDKLVDELHPQRNLSYNPLFQVMFVLHNAPVSALELPGLKLERVNLDYAVSKFDLILHATEQDGLEAAFEYSTELFEPKRIAGMAEHLVRILQAVGACPQIRLGELDLLSPQEKQAIAAWNANPRPLPSRQRLHEDFESHAAARPEAPAVSCGADMLSYGELNRRANRLAHWLRSQGVGAEVPIGICLPRSVDAIVAILGILKAGGAYVPIDPASPAERIVDVLEDCSAPLLLTGQTELARLPATKTQRFCLEREDLSEFATDNPAPCHDGSATAYIIYTSGSTGRPKGVMISHRNALASTGARLAHYPGRVEGFLLLSPLAFDSSVAGLFWTLSQGGQLCLPVEGSHQDMQNLVRLVTTARLSHLLCLPSLYAVLLEETDADRMTSLKTVIVAGETCPPSLCAAHFARLPGARLYNEYGPTEATVWCSVEPIQMESAESGQAISIGRPVANTQIHLLDAGMNQTPPGVPGEIHVGGIQLARGYLQRPDLTAERFVPNPYAVEGGERLYKTGDLARYRPDGRLEFLGRADHQIKLRGFRIELQEIEAKLRQCPRLADAAIILQEESAAEKRLVAYLVFDSGAPADVDFVRAFLQAALPVYMIPSGFVVLDRLPLTATGKLDRKALPAWDFNQQSEYAAPRNRAETILAGIWSSVLSIESVGIHDNFFDLGGDSIQAIQMCSRARTAGLNFLPRQLFQHQTIAELASVADQTEITQAEQGLVGGEYRLTPAQHWLLAQNLANPNHWNQALLLEVREKMEAPVIEQGMDCLLAHHDALRMRFYREGKTWRPVGLSEETHRIFHTIDLSGMSNAEQDDLIQAECGRWQASLDLQQGPLVRALWFDLGKLRHPRLLLIVHHLVVDGVSWRILLEDLQTVCRQALSGQIMELPRKSTSFKNWSERLAEWGNGAAVQTHAEYWQELAQGDLPDLPVDHAEGSRQERHAAHVSQELSEAETQALLRDAPAAYHTEINDLLLTALAQTLAGWSQNPTVLIDVEGHGREDLFEEVDLSRTVGWFTSLYPLRLKLPAESGPRAAIRAVKEQYRQLPGKGLDYGMLRYLSQEGAGLSAWPGPRVLFNYLGQFDGSLPEGALFALAPEQAGESRAADNERAHELDVNAHIAEGRLRIDWTYSGARYRQSTLTMLARNYMLNLKTLLMHCLSPEAGGLSPADFPLARLSQDSLDGLHLDPRNTEDLYPQTPLQQGLLLQSHKAPQAGVYILQLSCILEGALNIADFTRAWRQVVVANPILRTAFRWNGLEEPLQIVLREVDLPLEQQDWQDIPLDRQAGRWQNH